MSKSTPSLVALLGLVAFAGYQNRDRIKDMLTDAKQDQPPSGAGHPQGQTSFLSEVEQFFQTGLSGLGLSSALNDLKERFVASGQQATADTWISTEPNRPLDGTELEAALGHETLQELSHKTGLSREELILRLNRALPDVVNRMTPQGRLPTDDEAQALT